MTTSGGGTNTGNVFVPRATESYGYDADGNMTNDGRWSFTWDAENRLVSMQALSSVPSGAKKKIDFTYDYGGRRSQKIVSTWNGSVYVVQSTNKFVYDSWNLIAELNGTNGVVRSYIWGLDLSGTPQGAGGVGGLFAIKPSGTNTLFAAYDGNGNVTGLIDGTTGTTSSQYEYGPFGETIRLTPNANNQSPFRFSTKYTDDESDFLYYGYRYYNPSTGRWLSRDPIEENGGFNLFIFARNSPPNYFDFLGEYSLNFKGKWKPSEKDMVQQAFSQVQAQLSPFIAFVEKEIQKMEKVDGSCCPYKDEWLKALRKLLVQMRQEQKDLAGTKTLDITKKSLPGISAQAMFDKSGNVPIWEFQISTAKDVNFFNQPLSEQTGTIFHEASHYVGTEDQDVPETENAQRTKNRHQNRSGGEGRCRSPHAPPEALDTHPAVERFQTLR